MTEGFQTINVEHDQMHKELAYLHPVGYQGTTCLHLTRMHSCAVWEQLFEPTGVVACPCLVLEELYSLLVQSGHEGRLADGLDGT